jgi:hypothetical protein
MATNFGNTGVVGPSSPSTVESETQAFARTVADSAEPVSRSAADRFERINLEDGRVRITLGSAIMLTVLGSLATALYMRRKARARARQLILLSLLSNARSTLRPNAGQIAPLGGVGGSLLLAALIGARIRAERSQHAQHDLQHRLKALEAQLTAHGSSGQPRARDMMIGLVIGIVLSRLMGRAGASHAHSH